MNIIKLVTDDINIQDIMDLIKSPSCGAGCFFVGTTRDNFEGLEVISLKYEAYEKMAIKMLETICNDIRCKWTDVVNIAIYHRLGEVKIMEASVVVAISSPHRAASLEAVAYAIETLKASVPIWKKEEYKDERSVWKENQECPWRTVQKQE